MGGLAPSESNMAERRDQLKESLLRAPVALADRDLLELLLAYATPGKESFAAASELVEELGGLTQVLDASTVELMRVGGIGKHAAGLIRLVRELIFRYSEPILTAKSLVGESKELERYLIARFRGIKNEQVLLLFLNNHGVLLGEELLGAGTVDQVVMFPRQVMAAALKCNASSVILVHNHPHGPPIPSHRDREEAERLREILMPFDVRMRDSIIVGGNRCFSLFGNRPL